MKKVKFIVTTVILVLLSLLILDETFMNKNVQGAQLRAQIHYYMKQEKNQKASFSSAIALNGNSSSNACVYFVSEVLRRNNFSIPESICNTTQLITVLKERGWKKDNNYKNLQPGDIAFTTDAKGTKLGKPTHTYVFMGWVEEGSYDYAYICDNQAKDYDNQIYHIRNIKNKDTVNGITKDAFSFFMRPS